MMNARLSNLLFLTGLAGLTLPGCDPDDGESDSAGSATNGMPTGSTGGEAATAGETMGGSTSGGTTDTPDATTSEPTGSPTTAGGGASVCPPFVAKSVECNPEYDYATELGYCTEIFASLETYYGADCVAAFEDALACAATLDCEAFNAEEKSPGCEAEEAAFEELCDLAGGSTGGNGSGSSGG